MQLLLRGCNDVVYFLGLLALRSQRTLEVVVDNLLLCVIKRSLLLIADAHHLLNSALVRRLRLPRSWDAHVLPVLDVHTFQKVLYNRNTYIDILQV